MNEYETEKERAETLALVKLHLRERGLEAAADHVDTLAACFEESSRLRREAIELAQKAMREGKGQEAKALDLQARLAASEMEVADLRASTKEAWHRLYQREAELQTALDALARLGQAVGEA